MNIENTNQLLSHPVNGLSWEGWVIENLLAFLPSNAVATYFRTADGAELDLFIELGERRIAIEIKKSLAPKVSKGFHIACNDVAANEKYIVYAGQDSYPMKNQVTALSVIDMIRKLMPS